MSVVRILVAIRIIERRNCFVIFGTQPHMASADDYSCINDSLTKEYYSD